MTFKEFEIGKSYFKRVAQEEGRKRGQFRPFKFYKMLVTDKNPSKQEIQAVTVPENGKPTAPQWYASGAFSRWKTKEQIK